MKIIIFGANGMLGSSFVRFFREKKIDLLAISRNEVPLFTKLNIRQKKLKNFNDIFLLKDIFIYEKPDYVINCAGIIKQIDNYSLSEMKSINTFFPKILDSLSDLYNYKLIHFSTDCVFSGKTGGYTENSISDSKDDYGRSKFLGEFLSKNSIVIRTSIIGHGLKPNNSLIDWFLKQKNNIFGYSKAIFSGFPTIVLVSIVYDYILSNQNLHGLYHISNFPISKYDLLLKVKKTYNHQIDITSDSTLEIDRSLDCSKFINETNFSMLNWDLCIQNMYDDYLQLKHSINL